MIYFDILVYPGSVFRIWAIGKVGLFCLDIFRQLLTALPMLAVASFARSMRVGRTLSAKDLVIWDTNSTEMPTACRQQRKDMAACYLTKVEMHFNVFQHIDGKICVSEHSNLNILDV